LLARKHSATELDREIAAWIAERPAPFATTLAEAGHYLGSLPGVTLCTLLMLVQLWYRGRPWREMVAALGALIVSEAVGLLLVGLIHLQEVRPVYVEWWPYGYAGLVPMRALAVLGMIAHLIGRQHATYGYVARGLAALLVLAASFSVVWTGMQTFTETLLELAAGGLVLFASLWWLEGYGPGLVEPVQR
jgi:hypothetical protein